MKGQVSIEAFIAVGIILIFFVVSLVILGQINASATSIKTAAADWAACTKIANVVHEVFLQGPGTGIDLNVDADLNITYRAVYLGNVSCDFSAAVQNASLQKGRVRIFNKTGVVVLQNE